MIAENEANRFESKNLQTVRFFRRGISNSSTPAGRINGNILITDVNGAEPVSDTRDQQDSNQIEQKGIDMQVQDYCKAMRAEVTAWKEKLEAMKKTADEFGSEQKEKVLPLIGQIEQDVVNAQLRVDQLENECPSDWSPIKNDLDELFGTIGSNLDRRFQEMSSRETLW